MCQVGTWKVLLIVRQVRPTLCTAQVTATTITVSPQGPAIFVFVLPLFSSFLF